MGHELLESRGDHNPVNSSEAFYPYAWANPDVWESARVVVGSGGHWIKEHARRGYQHYKDGFTDKSAWGKLTHGALGVGVGVGAAIYATYPLVSDAINLVGARATGNAFLTPTITTLVDLPILGMAEAAWRRYERNNGVSDIDENIQEGEAMEAVLESDELPPEKRSLLAKAVSPVFGRADHPEAMVTTLYAGSQLGQLEDMAKTSKDRRAAEERNAHIDMPPPGWKTALHASIFGAESLGFAFLASRGHDGGGTQAVVDLALYVGLPVYLVQRGLNEIFPTKKDKTLPYRGYEKIERMVRGENHNPNIDPQTEEFARYTAALDKMVRKDPQIPPVYAADDRANLADATSKLETVRMEPPQIPTTVLDGPKVRQSNIGADTTSPSKHENIL